MNWKPAGQQVSNYDAQHEYVWKNQKQRSRWVWGRWTLDASILTQFWAPKCWASLGQALGQALGKLWQAHLFFWQASVCSMFEILCFTTREVFSDLGQVPLSIILLKDRSPEKDDFLRAHIQARAHIRTAQRPNRSRILPNSLF